MAKKFKITEAQRDALLAEGVAVNLPLTANKEIDKKEVNDINNKFGGDGVTLTTNSKSLTDAGSDSTTTIATESKHRLITKKQLQANRLRYLKENSEVLSLNNFMKKLH